MGDIFPNFELLPCFNIDVQPELVNNNFNDEKESLISRRRNANDNSSNQKTKSDLSVWIRWQPSTGKNFYSSSCILARQKARQNTADS